MPDPSFDLHGRVALVTGASSGLGRHFASTLARAGAAVALAARRADALDALAAEVVANGGRAVAVPMDVTDAASVEAGIRMAEQAIGPVDVLVNNAGIAVTKPLLEQTEADWDRVIDTDLKGAWLVAQAVARRMMQRGQGGAIVNIASILAARAVAQVPAYSAAKAGLVQLTRVMAVELARQGIRVNAMAPGYIETEINREFLQSEAGGRLIARIPQRRAGVPHDLDGALLLLASDAGRYMTGTLITVDGGHSLGL